MTKPTGLRVASIAKGSAVLLFSALLFPSCSQSGSGENEVSPGDTETVSKDTGFSQRDSAGILIAETTAEVAGTPLEWEIDPVPLLVLGSEENES